jgi:serine/threonine-protein kinase
MGDSEHIYRFGDFELDERRRLLRLHTRNVDVQRKVFDTLVYLVRNRSRVVGKEELIGQVWKGAVVTDHVLTRAISVLRKLLSDPPGKSRFIKSIPRVGYRFVADVEERGGRNDGVRTLTVLPFEATTDNNELLELGMTDTLITRLSVLPEITVSSFPAVRNYYRNRRDYAAIAAQLGSDLTLTGAIEYADERIFLKVRLVSLRGNQVLWTDAFDERHDSIYGVVDSIYRGIVASLFPHLTVFAPSQAAPGSAAYRCLMEGRLFLQRYTPADIEQAMPCFEKALDFDPAYAEAWAGLAECHQFLGTLGSEVAAHYSASLRACVRALSVSPTLADALRVRADIAWQFEWDWALANEIFVSALVKHPHHPWLNVSYSDFCCLLRSPTRAIEHATRALRSDPTSPWINVLLAQSMHCDGQFAAAIAQAEKALRFAPGFVFAHFFLGLAQFEIGDHETGLRNIELAAGSNREDFIGAWCFCLARSRNREAAQDKLAALKKSAKPVAPIATALANVGLERWEDAEADLDKCIAMHDWHVLLFLVVPMFRKALSHSSARGIANKIERLLGAFAPHGP